MKDRSRRRELVAQYKESRPEAGVYRIVNIRSGRSFLASTMSLATVQSRFAWAKSTNTASALDRQLVADFRALGPDAFTLEVLEAIQPDPARTDAELRSDLKALEDLWRERLSTDLLY